MRILTLATLAALVLAASAHAQSILFDFDNAPAHTPFPLDVVAGGVTAHLSGTGQGYSIQQAGVLGFTPSGFSGNCIYPDSVYLADLLVGFSRPLTDLSILYCSQELGCDTASRIRITAYMNGAFVGTNTATASCPNSCSWPTQTLAIQAASGFNSVVVHYDAPPPGCSDYGVVLLADNMNVTLKAVSSCPADFNGSGALSVQDIFDFLGAWFLGDPRADFNGVGGLQVQDIFDFLSAWFAGCP